MRAYAARAGVQIPVGVAARIAASGFSVKDRHFSGVSIVSTPKFPAISSSPLIPKFLSQTIRPFTAHALTARSTPSSQRPVLSPSATSTDGDYSRRDSEWGSWTPRRSSGSGGGRGGPSPPDDPDGFGFHNHPRGAKCGIWCPGWSPAIRWPQPLRVLGWRIYLFFRRLFAMLFRIFSIILRLISVLIVIPLSLFEYCLRCVEWLIGADDDD